MPSDTSRGGNMRSEAYLALQCTVPTHGGGPPKMLAAKTRSIGPGGLEILLPDTLPLRTPVLVQLGEGAPLRAFVVSVGAAIDTSAGPRVPHGMAFEHPVDPALVSQWLYRAERQAHTRAPAQFPVHYKQAGTAGRGTCLNLSRGGMFIATPRPASPGSQVALSFNLPTVSHTFSMLARVVWMRQEEQGPNAPGGMGVQFLDPKPAESALIGSVVEHLSQQSAPPPR